MRMESSLPRQLAGLWQLATNLRWTWHRPTQLLFRDLNPTSWNESAQNPLHQLSVISDEYLTELSQDFDFVVRVNAAVAELNSYMNGSSWFSQTYPESDLRIAYFSPEFGISEALPQYSGGLGVLAGDHLKTASDLGVPLVGVGLFYKYGYFTQELRYEKQCELYHVQNAGRMGLELCSPRVSLQIGDTTVIVRIWRVNVGRTRLYLLDTDHDGNEPSLRTITDRLYGGDHLRQRQGGEREHRLLQEIVLGIGGVKALRAVGEKVTLFHSNEGHAGFLGLERVRELVQDRNMAFSDAVEQVRQATIFTTHTPVPAGIDQFSRDLMSWYFTDLAHDCGVDFDQLMSLGQSSGSSPDGNFNMAFMGLRMARYANGVSRLHGAVSRDMFAHLYGTPAEGTPIGSVTNGVHPQTWTPPEMQRFFEGLMGLDWATAGPDKWARVHYTSDKTLWKLRCEARLNMVEFTRKHLREQLLKVDSNDADWCLEVLDGSVLTLGFARRKASYKRLLLLLSQPERLTQLLLDPERAIQIVIAGKAHPHDGLGHEIIERVAHFALDPRVRHRIVFLPDYNMGVARAMLDADVWLNTPIRPHEASGTSGQKSVYHGGLQLSVNDGWWDEMAEPGVNGWVIEEGADDAATADNLYRLIEDELVPAFYDRDGHGIPLAWAKLMKNSLSTLGPQVSSHRMVKDYVTNLYVPASLGAQAAIR